MEKIIIKTIREAFKKAYINKLIESAEGLAKGFNPDGLKNAESLYKLFITNKVNPDIDGGVAKAAQTLIDKDGKKIIKNRNFTYNGQMVNYAVEKAVEEYKQTKDRKIKDAIITLFDPSKSKIVKNTLRKSPGVQSNLKSAFGSNPDPDDVEDVLRTAWLESLGETNKFDEIVGAYQSDSPTGIGALFMNALKRGVQTAASSVAAKKRGGAGFKYIPEECKEELVKVTIKTTPFMTQGDVARIFKSIEQFEGGKPMWKKTEKFVHIPADNVDRFIESVSKITDVEGNTIFNVEATSETMKREIPNCAPEVKTGRYSLDSPDDIIKMKGGVRPNVDDYDNSSNALGDFDYAEDEKHISEDDAEKMVEMFSYFADEANQLSGLKETHTYLIDQFFKNRKSYEEILKQRPDLYPGKSVSDLSSTFINLVKNRLLPVAAKAGKIYGFPTDWLEKIMEAKSLKNIEQLFKIVDPGELSESKSNEFDVEKIMKEVYKRLLATNI